MSDNEDGYTTPASDFDDFVIHDNQIINQEIKKLLGNEILSNNNLNIYSINSKNNVKQFINLIKTYSYNAPLNKNHLESLKKEFNDKSVLVNTFIIVYNESDKNYYLYDGHHRAEVIKSLPLLKCPDHIIVNSYIIKNFNDSNAVKLFNEINSTKPYFKKEITEISKNIMNKLEINFNNSKNKIITDAVKRPNYPFLSRSKFMEKIQLELAKYHDKRGMIVENDIYNKLMQINEKLKKKFLGSIQQPLSLASYCKNNNKTSKQKKEIQNRFETIGCFLGVDKHYEYLSELNF
jgi:hypothetical protein